MASNSDIHGAVRSPLRGRSPLLVATDGSVATFGRRARVSRVGFGWVCSDGRWGLGIRSVPKLLSGHAESTISELRAIWYAIQSLRDESQPIILLTDCTGAIGYLDRWAAGGNEMPPGYLGSQMHKPTLVKLAEKIQAGSAITWQHVKGHNGHLLNEAADSLANIGCQWVRGRYTKEEAKRRAHSLVEAFMADRTFVDCVVGSLPAAA